MQSGPVRHLITRNEVTVGNGEHRPSGKLLVHFLHTGAFFFAYARIIMPGMPGRFPDEGLLPPNEGYPLPIIDLWNHVDVGSES